MSLTRRQALALGSGLLLGSSTRMAQAQDYPNKPVRVIVPFPAGTGLDVDSRFFTSRLSTLLGQPVIIENRPGAGGTIGADYAAKAAPDGYTLYMATTPISYIELLYTKLNYKPADFTAVSQLALLPGALIANPGIAAKNASDLVALSKAKPGTIRAATQGVGTYSHMAGEWFVAITGASIDFIPYNTSSAISSVMAGDTQVFFNALPPVMSNIAGGKLKALAITGKSRHPQLPDVPTFNEVGIPGFDLSSWFGLMAPAATPSPLIERIAAACVQIARMPEVIERYRNMGGDPVGNTPAEFSAFIKAEQAKWGPVVRRTGIKLD